MCTSRVVPNSVRILRNCYSEDAQTVKVSCVYMRSKLNMHLQVTQLETAQNAITTVIEAYLQAELFGLRLHFEILDDYT